MVKPASSDKVITGAKQTYEYKINLQHGLEPNLG
jgi:hypothetical protein